MPRDRAALTGAALLSGGLIVTALAALPEAAAAAIVLTVGGVALTVAGVIVRGRARPAADTGEPPDGARPGLRRALVTALVAGVVVLLCLGPVHVAARMAAPLGIAAALTAWALEAAVLETSLRRPGPQRPARGAYTATRLITAAAWLVSGAGLLIVATHPRPSGATIDPVHGPGWGVALLGHVAVVLIGTLAARRLLAMPVVAEEPLTDAVLIGT